MTDQSPVLILVVNDNAAKRLALKAILAPLGHVVVEADSGWEALRCVLAHDFAVILLDVRMPVMDGFETAALIRQRRQSELTPIIFVTAAATDEIVSSDRYAGGAVDFICAPVQPDELRAKVTVFANLFSRADLLATRAREVQAFADQLRLLTESAPIGIFRTDTRGHYVYTNPRWTEITGVVAEDAAGRHWDTILDRSAADDRLVLSGPLCQRFEIRSDGSPSRIVLVTAKSIPDTAGGIAGWVGTLADVTAEAGAQAAMVEARDKATEAWRLKSDFLANMSHEIRTPMNGVIGMTDLLLETELDALQRDYAQTARNSGEALLAIINDILDFSKVEAGKLAIEHIEFSVRKVVEDAVNLLARPGRSKGLDVVTIIEDSVPPAAGGDPGRVRQVLTNLIGNAIKFTRTGGIVVRVAAARVEATDTVIRFEISDTGDGIAPDQLTKIFQPFVQADTSTSRKYGGTGLGLAISGQLVALMQGDCGVVSRLGVGSTFWFTIRVSAETAGSANRLRGVSALIVGDDITSRNVLSSYLVDWGATVSTAKSGDAALAVLRTAAAHGQPVEVAFIGGSMPNGTADALRVAMSGDPRFTPRVVLPASPGEEPSSGEGPAAGFDASVVAPFGREELRAILQTVLNPPGGVAPAEADQVAPESGADPAGGLLLLAEDNPINCKVAHAMLASAGYRVDTVHDGAAAVRAVAVQRYDAILMDCQMPELDGYQATAAIRAREGSGRRTPIIALTAGARAEDRERCLAEGMDSHLAKPVSKDALLALVASSLRSGNGR